MLDTEVDRGLRSDIQDCLNSMLQTLAPDDLTHWLGLCKSVLSAAKTEEENKAEKGRIVFCFSAYEFIFSSSRQSSLVCLEKAKIAFVCLQLQCMQ